MNSPEILHNDLLSVWKFFRVPFLFIGICLVILQFFNLTIVSGHSMDCNYHNGEFLLGTTIFRTLDYGEVVVVKAENMRLIKRIIGKPNDTIVIKNDTLYRNGIKIEEPYINEPMENNAYSKWQLGEDEYFIMGDNRNHSRDSRYFGPVKQENIQYKILGGKK